MHRDLRDFGSWHNDEKCVSDFFSALHLTPFIILESIMHLWPLWCAKTLIVDWLVTLLYAIFQFQGIVQSWTFLRKSQRSIEMCLLLPVQQSLVMLRLGMDHQSGMDPYWEVNPWTVCFLHDSCCLSCNACSHDGFLRCSFSGHTMLHTVYPTYQWN